MNCRVCHMEHLPAGLGGGQDACLDALGTELLRLQAQAVPKPVPTAMLLPPVNEKGECYRCGHHRDGSCCGKACDCPPVPQEPDA